MPSVPTYIRISDLDSYLAILAQGKGAWTQFVHDALASQRPKQLLPKTVDPHTLPKGTKIVHAKDIASKSDQTAGKADGQPGPEAPEQESPEDDSETAKRAKLERYFAGPISKSDSARKKK